MSQIYKCFTLQRSEWQVKVLSAIGLSYMNVAHLSNCTAVVAIDFHWDTDLPFPSVQVLVPV